MGAVLISNELDPGAKERLVQAKAESPALSLLVDLLQESDSAFHLITDASSFEVAADTPSNPRKHRCRLKVFEVKEGQWAAFFYKRSAVPFSQDRFSYGAVTFTSKEQAADGMRRWLTYLQSGFDWELTPERLRRALTFDVPE